MTDRTILIDGDVYAYRAAASVERATNWGEDDTDDGALWTLHADPGDAERSLEDALHATVETQLGGADRIIIALTDATNWRVSVLPTYKGNRKAVRKPMLLGFVRQYLRDNYEVWERPGLEGDDILGILMTTDKVVTGEKICVTIDKDLHTIPGFHFNNGKPQDGILEVTQAEADRFHLYQTLMGDTTDGYTGCPGVGPQVASAFLDDPYILTPEERILKSGKRKGEVDIRWVKMPTEDVWSGIVSLFAKAGYTEAYALQQARVARILRASDYDFNKKEPRLWMPTILAQNKSL